MCHFSVFDFETFFFKHKERVVPKVGRVFQDAFRRAIPERKSIDGSVYPGFSKYLKAQIADAEKHNMQVRVELSGHSYGAAMATLAAVNIRLNHPSVDLRIWTWGSPKVGDKYFKSMYQHTCYRKYEISIWCCEYCGS